MELNDCISLFLQIGKEYDELNIFRNDEALSKTEFRLLREIVLERQNGKQIISADLAKRLGITRSAVSQLVTKLEKKGIVKCVDSITDHKIAYIELSDAALALYEEQSKRANEIAEQVVLHFGEERLEAFIKEYQALSKVLHDLHLVYQSKY